jgi:hypothetical protein
MKAVLGFLFILVGVTVGWLVLSGQLPNTLGDKPTPATDTSGSGSKSSNKTTPIGKLPAGIGISNNATAKKILGV